MTAVLPFESSVARRWPKTDRLVLDRLLADAGRSHQLDGTYENFDREVRPLVDETWIDLSKSDEQDGKVSIVGYEIPLNRHFYVYEPLRSLEMIDADIAELEMDNVAELREVAS